MSTPLRVLILEDRPADAKLMLHELRRAGYDVDWQRVETESDYISHLDPQLDVILADGVVPGFDASHALKLLEDRDLHIPLIVVTGSLSEEKAVELMRLGAADYLLKDRLTRLGHAVKQTLHKRQLFHAKHKAEEDRNHFFVLALDLLCVAGFDGYFKDLNPAWETTLGWSIEELRSRPFRDLLHPDDHAASLANAHLFATPGDGKTTFENRFRCKDGSYRWLFWNAAAVPSQGLVYAIARDITEQKRASEAMLERMRLADLSADIGQALTRNDHLAVMLRLCAQSMIRHLDVAFSGIWTFAPSQRSLELRAQAGMNARQQALLSQVPTDRFLIGRIAREKVPFRTNDLHRENHTTLEECAGRTGLCAFAGYPLMVENRLVGVFAFASNQPITQTAFDAVAATANQIAVGIERRRNEDSLRESQARLAAIVNTAMDAIISVNAEQRIILFNPAAEQIFGVASEEILGQPLVQFIPPESRGWHPEHVRYFAQTGESHQGMTSPRGVYGQRANGEKFPLEATISHSTVAGQKVFTVILRDITEQQRLEEQYRQAQKMEAVGRLAGGIAHDFNNLLTVILGYSEIAAKNLDATNPMANMVNEIMKAAERAELLTRRLLAFSRKQILRPDVLDLNALLADTRTMLGRLIGEDVDISLTPGHDLWPVRADRGQLEQVVMNLAINARDAMPGGGKISIETSNVTLGEEYVAAHPDTRAGQYIVLSVSDTGCGMDAATKARIFEPFFTTKEPERGTGLGLATVYGIVKQSGGHIEVLSELRLGATFRIFLPREQHGQLSHKSSAALDKTPSGTETVLLAEDEDAVRALTRLALQRKGYSVLEARNGEEALSTAGRYSGPIHLLVTDLVMPKLGGRQLAEHLSQTHPAMKVLYVSGYMDDANIRQGLMTSSTAFLQKPFSPEMLAQKVRDVLDS